MHVKICGITNLEDALFAVSCGADAVGFVFAPESPRFVSSDAVERIVSALPPFVTTVGVFTSGTIEEIRDMVDRCCIDRIQFHGAFPVETIHAFSHRAIPVIRVKDARSFEGFDPRSVRAFLLDTFDRHLAGGSGHVFNWDLAQNLRERGKMILAGGLRPDNVQEAVRRVRPYGIDVSSGVESRVGKKDTAKVRAFIEAAKQEVFGAAAE
ncbi:MAG: phosphoribosylanthranilate isomerase [Nitrospiria bacterium]